jgi:hypothetical protein
VTEDDGSDTDPTQDEPNDPGDGDPDPEFYWDGPDPDAPHECQFDTTSGDVDWVGEPYYGWGIVMQCGICGRSEAFYNIHLNHNCALEGCNFDRDYSEQLNALLGPVVR